MTFTFPAVQPYRISGGSSGGGGQIGTLTTDGPIFLMDGQPWRYKGASAFRLPYLFSEGQDIAPFCRAYAGYNTLRSWLFGIPEATANQPWDLVGQWDVVRAYIAAARALGFRVALDILPTYPRNDPTVNVQRIVDEAFDELADCHETLFLALVNEPDIYLKPDTSRLVVPPTRILWTSGDYIKGARKVRGNYGVDHPPRDAEWPEGCHRLMEFYQGGGPDDKSDPAHRFPWIADEPPKRGDVIGNYEQDVLAYYGGVGMFGAGGTVHNTTNKFGLLPTDGTNGTDDEVTTNAIALRGLDAFPADAAKGLYRRIPGEDDPTHRTYIKGGCMVRIRPRTLTAPEPGWTALGDDGILWTR